ncbi:hypothetical protein COU60_00760 [Candidatus Pacearchaeota archaeon CG10_big_fil_rev_8_21_14_0_10_34_76]|nr:MAG: hypothetical protein COU60_00760 [Candidatus Pacearchaeota archaeon CG10_big_fil_rev_8_21_14_0_10_34_76]
MKKIIKINNGKKLHSPARMYTKKDLEEMGVDYVEGAIYFNRAKPDQSFPEISEFVRKNMIVLNYPDCSATVFSEEVLKKVVDKQIELNSDFIVFPYFKKENDFDVKSKVDLCEELKLNRNFSKEIVLEMSYKSEMPPQELSDLSHNFDYLSVFYGAPFGGYPSFSKVVKRVVTFKALTGKRVFTIAVPFKFSGEHNKDCRFMPCFSLVAEGWAKNWKGGGKKQVIKVVDPQDLKSKDYTSWLESGYKPETILNLTNRTVADLFRKESKILRGEFEKYLTDGVLNEISNLTPLTYEDYIYGKFYEQYTVPLIFSYKEKLILELFKENPVFGKFDKSGLKLLEGAIRRKYNPLSVFKLIQFLDNLVQREEQITIQELVKRANNFGFEN